MSTATTLWTIASVIAFTGCDSITPANTPAKDFNYRCCTIPEIPSNVIDIINKWMTFNLSPELTKKLKEMWVSVKVHKLTPDKYVG